MLEGWGLARRDKISKFYASDGTERLFVINPENWTIDKIIRVLDKNSRPINKLNEMVFIGDKLFINIYLSSEIIQVDPETGNQLRSFDFSLLVDEFQSSEVFMMNFFTRGNCLNGIAYNKKTD